jgi:hypothetical protein
LYWIPITSSQGRWWVVGFDHYHVVEDSLTHNFQKTVLTLGTTISVVKIVEKENNITHILLECLDVLIF